VRAAGRALGLAVAGAALLGPGAAALADPRGQTPVYWWPAQVSAGQQALTVVYESSCSAGAPHALVAETAATITIELLATPSAQCNMPSSFGQLVIVLAHRVGGRPVVGARADPALPGGAPIRNVAGHTAQGSPRAPWVVGLDALDAKLALRRAGLIPHASSPSLTAEVVGEQQVGPDPLKVTLATSARPQRRTPAGAGLSGAAATPTIGVAPSPPPPSPAAPPTCADTDLMPTSANLTRVGFATLCLVNQQRVQAGRVALVGDAHLQLTADLHSLDMVVNDYFSHVTPAGEKFAARLLASGFVPPGTAYQLGENLAWATGSLSTPASVVAAWMHSAHHRANILNPGYRQTGLGIVPAVPAIASQAPGATYTQDFGELG
jgi:uncharacterized protein YkwD